MGEASPKLVELPVLFLDFTCKMHHRAKSYLYMYMYLWLRTCVLVVMVKTVYTASYSHCTHMYNERTELLEGLHCSFDRYTLEVQDPLPPISTLILDGVGCSQDWDVVRWVTTRLQSPEALQFLSVRRCHGIRIGENDMAPLANLRKLYISYGSMHFLHSRAFSSLKYIQSITLKSLRLRHFPSAIAGDFNSSNNHTDMWLPGLQRLDLASNAIPNIPAGTFNHLSNLTYLDLAANRLQILNAEPFRYLNKLETLNVSLNLISALPDNGFDGVLPNLQTLVMQNAAIFNLGIGSFTGLGGLRFLDLSLSTISTLHPLSLQGLDSLEEINILYNPLQSVPHNLLRPVNRTLRKINFSECKLSTIPPEFFEKLPQLEDVDLSKNSISSLHNISFEDSTRLKILNIAFNSITDIPLHIFDQTPSIKTVDLQGNLIADLQTLTFWNLHNLRDINLSHNNLTALGRQSFFKLPSLLVLDLSSNFLLRVPFTALDSIPSLQELNLANNLLTNFPELPFVNKDAKNPTMYPNEAVVVDIRHNQLWCDCDMYGRISDHEYIGLFWPGANLLANQRYKNYQELKCSWPPPLIGQTLYDLQQEYRLNPSLASTSDFFCPRLCQCYTRCNDKMNITFCNNVNLTSVPHNLSKDINYLILANNNISVIPSSSFAHMKKLLYIDLSGNHIAKIGEIFTGLQSLNYILLGQNDINVVTEENFKGLHYLTYLDLHQNSISSIEPGSFVDLGSLQVLYLDHNLMTGLQWEVLNSTSSLQKLTLHYNPFICDCDLMWLKDWLQTKAAIFENVDSVNCTTESNQTGSVVYFDDYEFMCNTTDAKINDQDPTTQIVAVCLGVLVLLMGIFAMVYRFRRVIQVVVYNHTGLRFSNKVDKDMARTYLYDAFVSFSTDDLNFVTQELVLKLESQEPAFRLCIHQRDFVVGECISTNIINAVETSRRTIIVLSNKYVASEWCSFEFKAAQQQLLTDHQNRLIVILLEEVNRSLLDKDLKLYLSTNTYLERKDSLFWEKLYYAMPDKKRVGLDQQQEDGEETADVEVELQEDLQQLII